MYISIIVSLTHPSAVAYPGLGIKPKEKEVGHTKFDSINITKISLLYGTIILHIVALHTETRYLTIRTRWNPVYCSWSTNIPIPLILNCFYAYSRLD